MVVVAHRRPDREHFAAVAGSVVEEIGMACQLVCDTEDDIAVSRVLGDLNIVETGNAKRPPVLKVLCDGVIDRKFLSSRVIRRWVPEVEVVSEGGRDFLAPRVQIRDVDLRLDRQEIVPDIIIDLVVYVVLPGRHIKSRADREVQVPLGQVPS